MIRVVLAVLLGLHYCSARVERNLAATVSGIADGLLDDNVVNATVYQPVSSTIGSLQNPNTASGWTISALNASLELSTDASYSFNYLTANGTTRFNVTLQLSKGSTAGNNPPAITARVHTVTCDSSNLASSQLGDSNSQALPDLQIVSSTNTITSAQAGRNITGSTVYSTLADYDSARAVGVYASGNLVACRNLQPPFPDFPNDWSATIEFTDAVNGSTYVYRELYSQSLNKIRNDVHSYGQDRILLTDTSSTYMTAITPSNGSCSVRYTGRRNNFITGKDNITLVSTADMLHFNPDQVIYVPGTVRIRGIECDVWQANVTLNFNRTRTNSTTNLSFTASFYFPVNQWLVDRESYHRMLKAVILNGTRNGDRFETWINYVNFRPRTVYAPQFEICAISPYGSGCNCTDKLRRAAFANITQIGDDGDDFSVNGDANAACKYGGSVPKGFVSAQSGPYVGLTIIGMIGGALITAVAMWAFYRKRVGVTITDNLGPVKFTDAPGT